MWVNVHRAEVGGLGHFTLAIAFRLRRDACVADKHRAHSTLGCPGCKPLVRLTLGLVIWGND